MSWPPSPPRRNRTNCLIPRINGVNLKLKSAARLASCHRAAARQRQRRRPHETSVATAPRRSGPRALALGDHPVFTPLVFCGVHGFADAVSKGQAEYRRGVGEASALVDRAASSPTTGPPSPRRNTRQAPSSLRSTAGGMCPPLT
jgi:hypothetical protein